MNKLYKKLFLLVFVFTILLIFSPKSFAGEQTLNNLDFDVELLENGDMQVTETWDIEIYDTNTLFKTFKYDTDLFDNISVEEITNGNETNFTRIDELMYHVTENCFYAMENDDGLFEIAWGVDVSGTEDKVYKISYTVKDIINVYNDCAELYWQFVGEDFEIFADKVQGNITLPYGISNIDDLRVWAHGPLNGNIEKISENEVHFEVSNLSTSNFLEVRISTPISVFELSDNINNTDRLNSIIAEETKWAEEANRQRERAIFVEKCIKVGAYVVAAIMSIIFIFKIIKNGKKLKETPKQNPTQEIKYFRDIPDETSTPAEAGFLYYFRGITPTAKIISATILDLALKGIISFEINQEDKKDITVIINKEDSSLKEDEQEILKYLKKIAKKENSFKMKEFEKYSNKHPSQITSLIEKINKFAEKDNVENKNYDKKIAKKGSEYGLYGFLTLFSNFINIFVGIYIGIYVLIPIVLSIYLFSIYVRLSSRLNGLTQKGIDRREEWKGLKKYMEDFSMLDEREVPELVLWEKYLVYATAFGIAEKVLKQLKIKYPELADDDYFATRMSVMYVMTHVDMQKSFETPISRSVIASSNYSSGSGSGGGFSGGRRRRCRWWRRRRPLNIKITIFY